MPEASQQPSTRRANPLIAFLAAVQFLTLTPPFVRRLFTPAEMGASVGFYPLVGALLGGLLFLVDLLLALFLPTLPRSALLLAVWVILTGALHLDGFLDSCDGLLGGYTPESRLEIMRDERVGAYALAGGVLLLLLKFSALASLAENLPARLLLCALLLSPTLGRWAISLALVASPYARPQGLGYDLKRHATWRQALLASLFTLLLTLALAWYSANWMLCLAPVFAALVAWLAARFALQRLPGLTGDLYGAINELVEAAVLLALVIIL
ncbi:MAG: adenosylcobinamide-GDP ribazoletransferase [Chloroflexota bacterium]